MTVATIAARLSDIEEGISGIVTAYDIDEIPNALATAQLPAMMNVPGEAAFASLGDGLVSETRTWYILLYVCPVQRPVEIAQRMSTAAPFMNSVRQRFLDRAGICSLTGIIDSELVSDSGITSLRYGDVAYLGAEFRLRTIEYINTDDIDTI